nr:glycosyltransferase [uncultured Pedobacter sp.]
MKKILHITPDLNFAINFVKPICLEQNKLGADVTIITTKTFYSSKLDKNYNSSYYYDVKFKIISLNIRLRKLEFGLIKSYVKYIGMLKNGKYDTIIFHTTLDTTFPILIAKIFSSARRIYFNHGVPSLGYKGFTKFVLEYAEKINMVLADKIYTISASMREALMRIEPNTLPCLIQPGSACGINLITKDFNDLIKFRADAKFRLGFDSNTNIAIYVGRFVKRKGVFDVIEAWKSLEYSATHLLLLVGPEENDLIKNGIELSNNIIALGYIENVIDYYLSSDILCVPSYHEGLGYTYLESASAGCVSICSDIPGPTDFIDNNISGLTVKPGSITDIANSIKYLFLNPNDKLRMSKRAFQSVLAYNQEIIAPKVANEFTN